MYAGHSARLLLLTILALLLLPSRPVAGQRTADEAEVRSRLVGAYRLVSYVVWDEDGTERVTPYTEGTIMYDPSGRMGVHLMHPDRPVPEGRSPSETDRVRAYSSYIAYYGSFSIDADAGYVVHHVEGGLSLRLQGTDQVRYYDLSSDGRELVLQVRDEGRVVGEVTWERFGDAEPEASAGGPEAAAAGIVTEEDIPDDIHRDSWARLPLPVRGELDPEGRRAFDVVVNPESRYADGLWGPVAMWIYSPEMVEHIFPASTYLRFGTEKDQRLTELAILATARELRSQYEWTAHEPPALEAGLEPEIVELVKRRGSLDADIPGLGERERIIIRMAREAISEERVGSETFARAREMFGDRGVMDLAGLIGYYSFVNVTLKTFDVRLEPGRERLLPDLW